MCVLVRDYWEPTKLGGFTWFIQLVKQFTAETCLLPLQPTKYGNLTACQLLGNLCTMLLYKSTSAREKSACVLYLDFTKSGRSRSRTEWWVKLSMVTYPAHSCRVQWLRGRAFDSRLRESGFKSCAAVLKPWASFFTLQCSSWLSCINEYLVIDSGGQAAFVH